MCAILDTNSFHKFKDSTDEDMEEVWRWLERRNGKIVYSNIPKFEEEWFKGGMHPLRDQLLRSGHLKLVSKGVQEKSDELIGNIKSDDNHIIALAIIAGVKILITNRKGDKDLITDFKSSEFVNGKVYTTKKHAHLLKKDTCP
ncbi:MAG: hypothetical protein OXD54_04480 [Candidatus Poribacteria bacterium]|nr:hypothetical protein [Candidatus Poribacteria bacterium]